MIGDIIFVRTDNLIGKIIRKITSGYYNHVGIMISDSELVEATYKGVKLTKLEKFDRLVKNNKAEYKIGTVKDISEKDRYSLCSFVQCQVGLNYDYLQILSLFMFFMLRIKRNHRPLDNKFAFICSELVAEAYDIVNINFNNNIELDLITPADIERSSLVIFN